MIQGVYAALLVPRDVDGRLNIEAFRGLVEFLISRRVSGVVLNGATGEYCLTSPEELKLLLKVCRDVARGKGAVLCGIGSPGIRDTTALGQLALEAEVDGLLLPMPHFFPYEQDDLHAFCVTAAQALPAPILLYNLPKFTTPIELATVQSIIADAPNVIGIKDSSGSIELLRGLRACRVIGNDSALACALAEGVCDAVISGVACVAPTLIQAVYNSRPTGASSLLNEFIDRLSVFPTPWGLKLAAQSLGLMEARFAQPLSERRRRQAADFLAWFPQWRERAEALLALDTTA